MRERVLNDLIAAMKNQEKDKLLVIRSLKSAIQLEEINLKRNLNDDEVINVISKQIKTRKESILEFEKGNRNDLIEVTKNEIKILEEYLPEPLTKEEIEILINKAFEEVKPTSIKEMGKIMAYITPLVRGKADISDISKIVKERLN